MTVGFTPVVGTWYHVAFTYDAVAGVETLYLNGSPVATTTTAKVIAYDSNPLIIGGDTTSGLISYPWAGKLDEVRVWNIARPAVDIQADMGRVLTGSESGLVAYYRLEAGSGTTAADLTSNHNDGTLGGLSVPTWVTAGLPPVTGDAAALSFDGVNDYVRIPDSPTVRPASALTVAAWVNFSGTPGTYNHIVAKTAGTGTNDSYVVWYQSGALHASSGSPTSQASQLNYTWSPTLGTWYNVAYTYDSTTGAQKLYVNGSLVASNTSVITLGYDTNPLLIGADYNNQSLSSSFFAGKIDEVSLWNVALSQATIQANMSKQLVGNESGLAAYYKLDEGSGFTAHDSMANHNDGSLGNEAASAPTWTTSGAPLNDLTTVPTAVLAIDRFTVNFNEDLLASAANNPNNYSLVEAGPDGIFGTGDDVVYALTPSYSGDGSRSVTFTLNPNPLQPGHYQFRTLPGLTDRAGNSVAAYTREFYIANPQAGIIEGTLGDDAIPGATVLPMTESPVGSGFFTSEALGTLFTGLDNDYYRFNAQAGDVVTIRIESDNPNMSTYLYLQNGAGTTQTSTGGGGTTQIQDYTITAPGLYYVLVSGNGNSTYSSHYTLRVDQGRGATLEVESNDTQASANYLPMSLANGTYGGDAGGALLVGDGGDYYVLRTLNAGNTIEGTLNLPSFGTLQPGDVTLDIEKAGSTTALATSTSGTINYVVPSDGIYYVHVVGSADFGIRAQYLLQVQVLDSVRPVITSTTLPTQGTTSTAEIDRFSVNFSEDPLASAANNPANFDLRAAGPDGTFGTGDDIVYQLTPLTTYTTGLTATYRVTNGPLQPGKYQFTIGLGFTDQAGNPLATPYVQTFTLTALSPYIIESQSDDTLATATSLSTSPGTAFASFVQTSTQFATGTNPYYVVSGDLNGDGKPDLVVANYSSNTISVLLGNGDGTFQPKVDYAIGGSGPTALALADLNGDGKLDVVVVDNDTSNISVLLGTGTGTFGAAVSYTTGPNPLHVTVADLNGDGKPDLVVANSGASTVSVLLGTGTGTFAAKVDYATGSTPTTWRWATSTATASPTWSWPTAAITR